MPRTAKLSHVLPVSDVALVFYRGASISPCFLSDVRLSQLYLLAKGSWARLASTTMLFFCHNSPHSFLCSPIPFFCQSMSTLTIIRSRSPLKTHRLLKDERVSSKCPTLAAFGDRASIIPCHFHVLLPSCLPWAQRKGIPCFCRVGKGLP